MGWCEALGTAGKNKCLWPRTLMLDVGSMQQGMCGVLPQFTGSSQNTHQKFGIAGKEKGLWN